VFELAAFMAPLVAGIAVPGALAWTAGRPPSRRAIVAGAATGALLAIVALASIGHPVRQLGPVLAITLSVAMLSAAVALLAEAAGGRPAVAQLCGGLAVCALYASVVLFGPMLDHAATAELDGPAVGRRVTLLLELNPLSTAAIDVFRDDLYHRPVFYALDFASYQHEPPRWTSAVGRYALLTAVVGALAAGVFVLRRRLAG